MIAGMQMFLHLLYPPDFQLFPEMIHSEDPVSVMNTLTIGIFHLKEKVPKWFQSQAQKLQNENVFINCLQ